jgi:probable rRNA maturation factor
MAGQTCSIAPWTGRSQRLTRMQTEVLFRSGVRQLLTTAECRRVLKAALRAGGAPPEGAVTLTLTDDAELAVLNAAHMGIDGPTDVLSFPLLPPVAFPAHAGQDPAARGPGGVGFALPPGEPPHLGDIVVSVPRAIEQAEAGRGGQTGDVRWSPADELRLLITHGALHLCGWDHADPAEEAAMRALERSLLGTPDSTV